MRNWRRGALAAACAMLAGGAQAQSSVQLMGLVDAFYGSMKMAGDGGRTQMLGSGGMTTSWWGMKGNEDLGGGLKATFALTAFMRNNAGALGRFTGDTPFSRDANVGLEGGFGSVHLGRDLAPNFLPVILFNPFGDSFTFSPLVLHANVPLFNATGWQATTPADTGWSNEVLYSSPSFGGASVNVHYQFSNVANAGGKRNVGANLLYFRGPFAATAFYESNQLTDPVSAVFATKDRKTDWMLGASYDFKAVKVYGTYGRAKSDTLVPQWKTASLGATIPMGSGSILLGTARTKVTPADQTRTTTTVGYDYAFSKQTDVYAMAMRDTVTSFPGGTSFGLGLRKRF
jgi:predicted porin